MTESTHTTSECAEVAAAPSRYLRRALIAPLALAIVAFLHSQRVAHHNQSPWKGGGFGMFSTVDSVGARFLRVYLRTPAGEIPVEIPENLEKRARQLCAAPNRTSARRLARLLGVLRWGRRDQVWANLAHSMQTSQTRPTNRTARKGVSQPGRSHTPIGAAALQGTDGPYKDWRTIQGVRTSVVAVRSKQFRQPLLDVQSARVEVWKVLYDRHGPTLRSVKTHEVDVKVATPTPAAQEGNSARSCRPPDPPTQTVQPSQITSRQKS